MRFLGFIVFCVAIAGWSPTSPLAAAESDLEAIRKCGAIEDSVKRLACFDEIAARQQGAADAAKAALAEELTGIAATGRWRIESEQSKIDDSSSEYASVISENAVKVRFGEGRPSLMLRCMEHKTSAYIDFDGAFVADSSSYGDVTFRVDKKPAFVRTLGESTDNSALGFWSGGAAIPFIKSLFGGASLTVRATPFNESAITFEFDIRGVENAVAPLRKACAW